MKKARRDKQLKAHSIAFRVEDEWKTLARWAKQAGTSIPFITKQLLFKEAGLRWTDRHKRRD
jgi:hypothetical protein